MKRKASDNVDVVYFGYKPRNFDIPIFEAEKASILVVLNREFSGIVPNIIANKAD